MKARPDAGAANAGARRGLLKLDYVLLLAVGALLVLGLLMVYSATFDWGYQQLGGRFAKAGWQLLWIGIGTVALVVCARVPYDKWEKFAIPIIGVTVGLLLIVLLINTGGRTAGGEVRRNILGGSIQPSEPAKLGLIVYMAAWLSSKGERIRDVKFGLIPFAVLIGILAGLLVAQPDLSAAILIVLVALAMFFFAGADVFQFTLGCAVGGAVFFLLINRIGYAMKRISEWVLLWQSPEQLGSRGWHNLQALISLGSGGLFGVGLGQGVQKTGYLPAPHTDSIFAVIGQELGLAGCLLVLGLFVVITYRGFRIALAASNGFAMLLAFGLTCSTAVQALLNIGVVSGLIPFTGVALPFLSFGGSALVTSMAGIGVLLSISQGERVGRRVEKSERVEPKERQKRQQANLDRRWWHGRTRLSRPRRSGHAGRR